MTHCGETQDAWARPSCSSAELRLNGFDALGALTGIIILLMLFRRSILQ